MKTPAPGAKRFFFIPSPNGMAWDLAEAVYRKGAWHVDYPGHGKGDTMAEVPPAGADWIEMVPPGREPRQGWPDLPKLGDSLRAPSRPKVQDEAPRATSPGPSSKPKPVPKKAIPSLSRELEDLMLKEQRGQKAPEGKVQCPLCGLILDPTRNKRVRTHDNPLKGARCAASGTPWADHAKRPPRPTRK